MDSHWGVRSTVPSGPVGMHVGIGNPGETNSMTSKSGAWTAAEDIEKKIDNAMGEGIWKRGIEKKQCDIYMRG
jgi:hypothetical protein